MVHEIELGKRKKMSFSRIEEVLQMPDFIEIQKNSYNKFLEQDLKEVFADISPITDYSENLLLEFVDYTLEKTPKYSVEECKERDVNYAAPLRVLVRLINKETGEVKEQEVFMGDFPLMTEQGTFIINGEMCIRDREQTHDSLRRNLLEEAYEVLGAIQEGDPFHMAEEFGDLLLQIALHAVIGEEHGEYRG